MVSCMNVITRTMRVGSLTLALLACFTIPASAQAFFPKTLSGARLSCNPARAPHYVPGHYETVRERVRIPGSCYRVWVSARYRSSCGLFGSRHRRGHSPGHYEIRRRRDRYEYRTKRVWVPGHYSY